MSSSGSDSASDRESRLFQAGRAEPWFRRTFPHKATRLIAKVLIVGLVFSAIGLAGGFLLNRATGVDAGAVGAESSEAQQTPTCSTDRTACRAAAAAKKFRQGEFHRSSGFRPGKVFKAPKVAKRIIVRKIERKLKQRSGRPA